MRVVLNGKIFSRIATACTDHSWELCRQFCYAMVEKLTADRLTEGLFCYGVDRIAIRHIGICHSAIKNDGIR